MLKTEYVYCHQPATFFEANDMISHYIYFYNYKHIQLKTGETPRARRLST